MRKLIPFVVIHVFIAVVLSLNGFIGDFWHYQRGYKHLLSGGSLWISLEFEEIFLYGPLIAVITAIFYLLLGWYNELFALKMCMTFGNILTTFMIYKTAELVKDNKFAFRASLFYLLNPIVFLYSNYLQCHADGWNAFFIILSLYFYLKNNKFLTAISIGLGFMIKYAPLIVILPILASRKWSKGAKGKLVLTITCIVVAVYSYFTVFVGSIQNVIYALAPFYFYGLRKGASFSIWARLPQYLIYGKFSIWSLTYLYAIPLFLYYHFSKANVPYLSNISFLRATFWFYALFCIFSRYIPFNYLVWILPLMPFIILMQEDPSVWLG